MGLGLGSFRLDDKLEQVMQILCSSSSSFTAQPLRPDA
jgi:hypothetical protein